MRENYSKAETKKEWERKSWSIKRQNKSFLLIQRFSLAFCGFSCECDAFSKIKSFAFKLAHMWKVFQYINVHGVNCIIGFLVFNGSFSDLLFQTHILYTYDIHCGRFIAFFKWWIANEFFFQNFKLIFRKWNFISKRVHLDHFFRTF